MKKIGKDIEVDIEGAAAIMGIAKRTFMQKYSTKIPGNRVKKTKTFLKKDVEKFYHDQFILREGSGYKCITKIKQTNTACQVF